MIPKTHFTQNVTCSLFCGSGSHIHFVFNSSLLCHVTFLMRSNKWTVSHRNSILGFHLHCILTAEFCLTPSKLNMLKSPSKIECALKSWILLQLPLKLDRYVAFKSWKLLNSLQNCMRSNSSLNLNVHCVLKSWDLLKNAPQNWMYFVYYKELNFVWTPLKTGHSLCIYELNFPWTASKVNLWLTKIELI